ncbi:MAG: SRPBCC family protein [Candidatus Kapaibacterium sp.]
MDSFKILAASGITLFVLLVTATFIMPSEFEIDRSIIINADKNKITHTLTNLKTWKEWSFWNKTVDSTLEFNYKGNSAGIGAVQFWEGDYVGYGSIRITDLNANEFVKYRMSLNDEYITDGMFELLEVSEGTKVRLIERGRLGWNPLFKIIGYFADDLLGNEQEETLKNLKKTIES